MTLKGNALVGQSGGPTSVINSSLYGVIAEARTTAALKMSRCYPRIEGVLKREIIDLPQDEGTIQGLTRLLARLCGCRYRVQDEDLERIFQVFQGTTSSTSSAVAMTPWIQLTDREYASETEMVLRVIGIPKTIDNDLPVTHHCPGFGSCAKYVATSVRRRVCTLPACIPLSQ